MIELLILGIVLFIVGVGATIIYDKQKEQRQINLQRQTEVAKVTRPKRTTRTKTSVEEELVNKIEAAINGIGEAEQRKANAFLRQVKAHQEAGYRTVDVGYDNKQQTMSVNELIQRLEEMKKKL